LKKPITHTPKKKKWGRRSLGGCEGVDPEFKPQNCKNKKRR
jgi:hypothetical protein